MNKKLNIWFACLCLFLASPALASTAQYTYDKLNRLVQVQFDDGTTIQYAYDAAGNRTVQQVVAPQPPEAPAASQSSGSATSLPMIENSTKPTRSAK
jgi:YD repeat-containing protein